MSAIDLHQLSAERKDWVNVSEKIGIKDGIERLLTNLYPDTAHFAFELLQNAEDAGAKNVVFTLQQNQLSFEHNGRLFSVSDIESITNIANSTKKGDDSSIGKFGIGFKSVFSYTTEPEIESGQYHFRIQNMVVPILVDSPSHNDTETRFTFPFNHQKKSPEKAFAEIQKQLCDLPETTLLFLNSIESIKVCVEEDFPRETIRSESDNVVDIVYSYGKNETSLKFFRIDKKVEIIDSDEDNERKECRIAAAFCLETSKNGKLQIVPCDQGLVSIFFPCFSVRSNLKFHVHAPFASTPARSEVKNTQANVDLLTNLADLIAESVLEIKQRGWLSIDFLSVLPNSNDNVPDFYKPIYDKILNVFRNNELLPLQNGGYGKCTDVFYSRNEKDIELFTDDDLCQLCDSERSWMEYWKDGSRITPFVKDITVTHWNSETYLKYLQSQHIEKFLRNKSIGWLRKFYEMLNELIPRLYVQNRKNTIKILSESRIVRIQDGTHCSGLQCFFPPDDSSDTEGWKIIDRKLLPDGSDDRDKEHRKILRDFLETIGVNPLNKIERLKRILNEKYARPLQQPPEQYIKDLQLFIAYTESESKDASIFKDKYILFAVNHSESVQPQQIYVDNEDEQSPLHTGLSAYYNQLIGKVDSLPLSLADIYKGILPEKLEAFLRKVGCIVELYINTQHWCYHRNCQNPLLKDEATNQNSGLNFYSDYSVLHIDKLSWTIPLSHLLWHIITNSPEKRFAHYRVLSTSEKRCADSILVQQLREAKWIPQSREDTFCFVKPTDAEVDLLPLGFPYESESAWLKAIEFGRNVKIVHGLTEEQISAALAIKGIPRELVNELNDDELTTEETINLLREAKEAKRAKNTQSNVQELTNNGNSDETEETFNPRYPDPKDAPLRIYESAPPNVASPYSAPTSTTSVSKHCEKNDVDSNSESKDKQAVGRYGEQYAVLALRAEFSKDEGYEIHNLNSTGIGVGCDIEVHKNGEIVRIIEVKTTTASGEYTFNVSGTQWENGRREDDKFWLYCVFNAEDEPFLVKKQNPIKLWKAGELVAHPVGVIVKAIIPDGQ